MKKVIKLTESQLKQMVKDTINEQSTTKYFDVYEKADGVKLKPTKDPNCKIDDSNSDADYYIWNNGTYLQQDKPDRSNKYKGKMNILSDESYNIVYENGAKYDSATRKFTPAPNKTPKINTVNCANQLIDTSKGKILKFGCKTQGVKELQTLLDVLGKDGVPTGYFGSRTKQAVIDFQKKNKLKKTEGIVGPETYKALTPNAVPPPAQDVKEYDDMYDDEEDSYNYLQSLFNTEDDFDGEVLRGDEDGFSNKVRFKQLNKNIKADHLGMGAVHPSYCRKKDIEVPRDKEGKEIKYSPIKSDDLPLDKYLEKKKMNNLDEEDGEDGYDHLNSLFTKD
jgi:peptidoglycan hydrolase-like protein with peptidoglycan-binding domain